MQPDKAHQSHVTRRQTVQQSRAKFAWKQVASLSKQDSEKYLTMARSAPSMVITNGLGPTLAFFLSKKGAERILYDHLEEWLCDACDGNRPVLPSSDPEQQGSQRLIKRLVNGSSDHYRRATTEALALLDWLKRFAEAAIQEPKKHGTEH